MLTKKYTIILAGGGTGGHIFPLMQVASKLKEIAKNEVLFEYLGSGMELERRLANKNEVNYRKILTGKFRRNLSLTSFFSNIFDFVKFIAGFCQAVYFLFKIKPDVIFSKGGYVSLPVVLAGAFWQVPIIVHESDLMPGLANRLALRFARRIGLGFPMEGYSDKFVERGFYCSIPLRDDFYKIWKSSTKIGNYILVIGGSSGAKSLNDKIFEIAPELLAKENIVHITGAQDYTRAIEFKKSLPDALSKKYELYDFIDDIPSALYGCKIVVSRAGATAIAEIAASKKKALFVPLSVAATPHQAANSRYLERNGLAESISNEAKAHQYLEKIRKILKDEKASKLEEFYFPFSAELIARIILDEIESTILRRTNNFFLIGIRGVSMSGLAKILREMGKNVFGSDLKLGGHSAQNITENLDLVVYSSAASASSAAAPEHNQAKKLNIPTIKRSQMIGWMMRGKKAVAVSGMHGKTTITNLIARMYEREYPETSYLIGADSSPDSPSANYSTGGFFIAEACEYDDSFLDFPQSIAVISNIEKEHLDYFKDLTNIKRHFASFIDNTYPGGFLVYCADDKNTYEVVKSRIDELSEKRIKVVSYGFKPTADFVIYAYRVQDGKVEFSIKEKNLGKLELTSRIAGKHFALNCAAAIAVSQTARISKESIVECIAKYRGANRRFSLLGQIKNILVYDDYAHHPTELTATLRALSELYPKRTRIALFQPHQQSRFDELYEDFVHSLRNAPVDKLFILPVYRVPGRDSTQKHSAEDLVRQINTSEKNKAEYVENYESALDQLKNQVEGESVIITMGATDVWKVSHGFMKKVEN